MDSLVLEGTPDDDGSILAPLIGAHANDWPTRSAQQQATNHENTIICLYYYLVSSMLASYWGFPAQHLHIHRQQSKKVTT